MKKILSNPYVITGLIAVAGFVAVSYYLKNRDEKIDKAAGNTAKETKSNASGCGCGA
jgi:hypothetical protein